MIKLMDSERQHREHAKEYEKAILEVLRSGSYIMGECVHEFEKKFAEYIGVKYAISVGNGTDALQIALLSLGIGPGDEVITTPFTFFATAEAIGMVGAIPVFVDIEEDTYCLDTKQIQSKITERTKAILPVHLFGHPADMYEICHIAEKNKLKIVEDCAQSTGALIQDKKVGAWGDVGCFSFFPTKNLGCAGDGGMITTNDDRIAQIVKAIRIHGSGIHGMNAYNFLNKTHLNERQDYDEKYSKYYNFLIGRNSRLDTIQAAILSKKIDYLTDFNIRRKKIADFYTETLKNTGLVVPKERDNCNHSWCIYSLRHSRVNEIVEKLESAGINTGRYYPVPLHQQIVFKQLGYKKGDFPVAEKVCRTVFQIPIYPELTGEELEYISEMLLKIIQ